MKKKLGAPITRSPFGLTMPYARKHNMPQSIWNIMLKYRVCFWPECMVEHCSTFPVPDGDRQALPLFRMWQSLPLQHYPMVYYM